MIRNNASRKEFVRFIDISDGLVTEDIWLCLIVQKKCSISVWSQPQHAGGLVDKGQAEVLHVDIGVVHEEEKNFSQLRINWNRL